MLQFCVPFLNPLPSCPPMKTPDLGRQSSSIALGPTDGMSIELFISPIRSLLVSLLS